MWKLLALGAITGAVAYNFSGKIASGITPANASPTTATVIAYGVPAAVGAIAVLVGVKAIGL